MKNQTIPNLLKFGKALLYTLFLAVVFSAAFTLPSLGTSEYSTPFAYVPEFFAFIFLVQVVLGPIIGRATQGSFKDDSLVINDTTYAGTFAPYFILPALFGMDSYNKGLLYIKDGIKKKHTIGKMNFSKPLQPRVATPTSSGGDISIDGNVLEPQDLMVYQEFNPRDLEVHWTAEELSASLLTRQLPPSVENYVSMLIVGRAFEQVEIGTWMGSTNYQNNVNVPASDPRYQLQFFDGFLKKMISDSSVYKASGAVALTASNIGAAMLDLYQRTAINNKALLTKANKYERLKFVVSINTGLIWEEFLTTQPYKNNDTTERGINKYKGFEIVPVAGMPDDTILFGELTADTEGNCWVGMNSILDENFQLSRLYANSELFFFKMLAKFDVNYGFADKIFLYTTLTANDFIA
jgi:hypothetical protein